MFRGGHTSTKKISQDPNFKVDGVLYFANQHVFDRLCSNPDMEDILGESFNKVLDSLNQDKESTLRYISQGIPVEQIVVIDYDPFKSANIEPIKPVNNQLLVMPEFEPIRRYGTEAHRNYRKDYMNRVFSIFDGFLRNDLGLSGKLISIAKRKDTVHYKEVNIKT